MAAFCARFLRMSGRIARHSTTTAQLSGNDAQNQLTVLRHDLFYPLILRGIAPAMRLEGLRPQPGLHGSPSDAKHRPETARYGNCGDGANAHLLTMRIQ